MSFERTRIASRRIGMLVLVLAAVGTAQAGVQDHRSQVAGNAADRIPAAAPAALPDTESRPLPVPEIPSVRPGGVALPTNCSIPDADEPVDNGGCARFSGVLRGVDFVGGSARLTPLGGRLLDRLATELNAYPDAIVEIQAHVSGASTPDRARALSRDRAVTIARRLAANGVSVSRLRARAFGNSRPRAGNGSAGGRRLNERIEIDVVP